MIKTKKTALFSFALALIFVCMTFSACADTVEQSFPAKGVDLSSWQNEVNFSKLKEHGISFVILRAGTSKGKDVRFEKYYREAKSAGLDIGCYFYTYALDNTSAEQDAQMLLKWLKKKKLQYPVYYDVEDDSLLALSVSQRTGICERFRESMEEEKYLVGLYANESWMTHHLDMSILKEKFEIWMAKWTDSGNADADMSKHCRIWQYTDKGSVKGVSTAVDMDVCYYDYPSYVQKKGFNNYHQKQDVTEALKIGEIWKTSGTDMTQFLTFPQNGVKIGVVESNSEICVVEKKAINGDVWGKAVIKGIKGWVNLNNACAMSKASVFLLSDGGCRVDAENRNIYGLDGSTENMLANVYASNLGIKLSDSGGEAKLGFVFDGYVLEELKIVSDV